MNLFNYRCFRAPLADIFRHNRKKRDVDNSSTYEDDYYEYDFELLWNDDSMPERSYNVTYTERELGRKIWGKYVKYKSKHNDIDLPANIYCDLIDTLEDVCLQRSLLEIWQYDKDSIMSATQEEILEAVNSLTVSPYFTTEFQFGSLLGGVKKNSSGRLGTFLHFVSGSSIIVKYAVECSAF